MNLRKTDGETAPNKRVTQCSSRIRRRCGNLLKQMKEQCKNHSIITQNKIFFSERFRSTFLRIVNSQKLIRVTQALYIHDKVGSHVDSSATLRPRPETGNTTNPPKRASYQRKRASLNHRISHSVPDPRDRVDRLTVLTVELGSPAWSASNYASY